MSDYRDAKARAADEAAFERGPAPALVANRCAAGFIQTIGPTGDAVVFTPGEMLPEWAIERLATATYDETSGVWTLPTPKDGRHGTR
jgi:hypothetical protein